MGKLNARRQKINDMSCEKAVEILSSVYDKALPTMNSQAESGEFNGDNYDQIERHAKICKLASDAQKPSAALSLAGAIMNYSRTFDFKAECGEDPFSFVGWDMVKKACKTLHKQAS